MQGPSNLSIWSRANNPHLIIQGTHGNKPQVNNGMQGIFITIKGKTKKQPLVDII
jgi:hypothetical protein